jgi:hypothetical protein
MTSTLSNPKFWIRFLVATFILDILPSFWFLLFNSINSVTFRIAQALAPLESVYLLIPFSIWKLLFGHGTRRFPFSFWRAMIGNGLADDWGVGARLQLIFVSFLWWLLVSTVISVIWYEKQMKIEKNA